VTAEELVGAIGEALSKLNQTFDVYADAAVIVLPGHEQRAKRAEDDLVVQFLVQQSEGGLLNLDIRRVRGNSFRFHSLYRDFRKAMAAINGWDDTVGEYQAKVSARVRRASVGCRAHAPPGAQKERDAAPAGSSHSHTDTYRTRAHIDRVSSVPAKLDSEYSP
jgi:hypothetical protein